jgi:hypothetical protein
MTALNPRLPLEYAANGMFQLGYVFPDISGPLDHYVRIMGSSSFVQLKDAKLLIKRIVTARWKLGRILASDSWDLLTSS